jgi:hypothetical protein
MTGEVDPMTKPWLTWFRRRRHGSRPAHRRVPVDRRHRRPAFERVEDRWMLSGPGEEAGSVDGFIDVGKLLAVAATAADWCDYRSMTLGYGGSASTDGHGYYNYAFDQEDVAPTRLSIQGGRAEYHGDWLDSSPASGPAAMTGGSSVFHGVTSPASVESINRIWTTQVNGASLDHSGARLTDVVTNDIQPIRLPADGPSARASEQGLIDVAPVLDEPVGLCYRLVHRQERMASVGKGSDRIGPTVTERDLGGPAESGRHARAFHLAASWGSPASRDISPGAVRLVAFRDSPFRPIEGARGRSQAFDLATAGDEILAASPGGVPAAPRFDSPSHEPDRASSDKPSPGARPLSGVAPAPSGRILASVAGSAAESVAAHEAVFDELARPLGDADLNAVYAENKRVTDLIPLLAVGILTHHLAGRPWDKPVNDRIGVAYPRLRRPL